jgi:predicted oxidoreductase
MEVAMETFDVIICGGGLAGLACAYDLLERKKKVLLLDRDSPDKLGGLAKKSFGGIMLVGTPHQKRSRIPDSPELAFADWQRYAEFSQEAALPRQWAEYYCSHTIDGIFEWLKPKGVEFLPVVNWPERGLFVPGNSVPRWHITWGTGFELINRIVLALENHPARSNLTMRFQHRAERLIIENGSVKGVVGRREDSGDAFAFRSEHIVLASGGMCGGDLSMLKANWNAAELGPQPERILNGSHRFADGILHTASQEAGAAVDNLHQQWNYAAGIPHPQPEKPDDGLSLVPPRSALWITPQGKRFAPMPLVSYTDTRYLVEAISKTPGQYAWLVLNQKIAEKELAVSGSDYMTAFRNKNKPQLLKELLFGNKALVERLHEESTEFVFADSLEQLAHRMNMLTGTTLIAPETLVSEVRAYDSRIRNGAAYHNDHQLRWIQNFRQYRGDRMRVCNFQPIEDKKAGPLIAVRTFILSRKSLGGVRTDLNCRVLNRENTVIPGLYAVGETAGFGGGGIHGKRSLEGTFLGGCILTGRKAAEAIG